MSCRSQRATPPLDAHRQRLVTDYHRLAHWYGHRRWAALGSMIGSDELEGWLNFYLCEAAAEWDRSRTHDFGRHLLAHLWNRLSDLARRAKVTPHSVDFDDVAARHEEMPATMPDGWREHLTERQRDVVESHYFGGESCREIGDRLGVSRQYVEQIRSQALAVLSLHVCNPF